jgi:hypothetical protein
MADDIAAVPTAGEDERRLHELGYAQELMRRMSGFSNFAVSFTIISILSGCLTLYYFGMDEGGPAIIVWGWPVVGIMTLLVGLSMAEVCSSFPTAGGLYYWSARPGPGSPAGSTSSARSRSPRASTSARRCSSTSCSACGSTSTRLRAGTRS